MGLKRDCALRALEGCKYSEPFQIMLPHEWQQWLEQQQQQPWEGRGNSQKGLWSDRHEGWLRHCPGWPWTEHRAEKGFVGFEGMMTGIWPRFLSGWDVGAWKWRTGRLTRSSQLSPAGFIAAPESPSLRLKEISPEHIMERRTEHVSKGEFERDVFWVEVMLGILEVEREYYVDITTGPEKELEAVWLGKGLACTIFKDEVTRE